MRKRSCKFSSWGRAVTSSSMRLMIRARNNCGLRPALFPLTAPFAQKYFSINLDTHVREEQHHLDVSQFQAKLPLRPPRAVSLTPKLRTERQEGSTSSARFSPLPRRLLFYPIQRTAHSGPQRFQTTTFEHDSLRARTVFAFLKEENTKCRNKTKLSSVVCLKNFGTRAICRWQTSSLPLTTPIMTLRHPILATAPRVKGRE